MNVSKKITKNGTIIVLRRSGLSHALRFKKGEVVNQHSIVGFSMSAIDCNNNMLDLTDCQMIIKFSTKHRVCEISYTMEKGDAKGIVKEDSWQLFKGILVVEWSEKNDRGIENEKHFLMVDTSVDQPELVYLKAAKMLDDEQTFRMFHLGQLFLKLIQNKLGDLKGCVWEEKNYGTIQEYLLEKEEKHTTANLEDNAVLSKL